MPSVPDFCRALAVSVFVIASTLSASADAAIPAKDIPRAMDSPLLKRCEGSFIVNYDKVAFTDFKVPRSVLEEEADQRNTMNNRVFLPKKEIELEVPRTRLVYLQPNGRFAVEVLRNYQDEITAAGG